MKSVVAITCLFGMGVFCFVMGCFLMSTMNDYMAKPKITILGKQDFDTVDTKKAQQHSNIFKIEKINSDVVDKKTKTPMMDYFVRLQQFNVLPVPDLYLGIPSNKTSKPSKLYLAEQPFGGQLREHLKKPTVGEFSDLTKKIEILSPLVFSFLNKAFQSMSDQIERPRENSLAGVLKKLTDSVASFSNQLERDASYDGPKMTLDRPFEPDDKHLNRAKSNVANEKVDLKGTGVKINPAVINPVDLLFKTFNTVDRPTSLVAPPQQNKENEMAPAVSINEKSAHKVNNIENKALVSKRKSTKQLPVDGTLVNRPPAVDEIANPSLNSNGNQRHRNSDEVRSQIRNDEKELKRVHRDTKDTNIESPMEEYINF